MSRSPAIVRVTPLPRPHVTTWRERGRRSGPGAPLQVLSRTAAAVVRLVALACLTVLAAAAAPSSPAVLRSRAAAFERWMGRLDQTRASSADLEEGRALARERTAALTALAETRPSEVLVLALPSGASNRLPPGVRQEVEQWISAIGDYTVYAELGPREGEETVRRTVTIGGQEYPAFTYGRRLEHLSKQGIPLSGVLVGGVFVLAEDAIREVPAAEVSGPVDELEKGADPARAVVGLVGGRFYRFASREKLLAAEKAIRRGEAALGPHPRRTAAEVLASPALASDATPGPAASTATVAADTAWANGTKKVLLLRVDFPDLPGDPKWGGVTCTAEYAQGLLDNKVAPFYANSSYGATRLLSTVSATLYRMPATGASYAASGDTSKLFNDAVAAAGADFNVSSYDRVIVAFPSLGSISGSKITFGGQAIIGGSRLWANGEVDFRILSHELGHNYGLLHAGSWEVSDGNPASEEGRTSEYGDPFSAMGMGNNNPLQEFSPSAKVKLGWLTPANTQTVTASGMYRVYNFGADNPGCKSEVVALLVNRDGGRTYWLSYRGNYSINAAAQNGAYVYWEIGGANCESVVLDLATPGNTFQDSPLQVGSTFVDTARGITLRTVARGGTAPNTYLDIEVTVPGPPAISQQPASVTAKLGDSATFTLAGSANTSFAWQWASSASGPWTALADGPGVSGARTASLTLEVTPASASRVYRCVLTNAKGTLASSVVNLSAVAGSPEITRQPSDAAAFAGQAASFSIAASAAASFQWQASSDSGANWSPVSDGSVYAGATTASLRVTASSGLDGFRYRCAAVNANGKVYSASASLSVVAASGSASALHMTNISTRCFVGTGDKVAIAGFILNRPARVVIRGVGPTLAKWGVDQLLLKPVLTLFDGAGRAIAANTGWKSDPAAVAGIEQAFSSVSAFPYTTDDDCALVVMLPAGGYTAQLSGAGGTTGNALIEVYLDTGVGGGGEAFFNLSSRIYVKTGSSIAIAGVILSQPSRLLVRAVGPTLETFSVSDVLRKPVIELVNASSRTVATNTGWRTADPAAVGAANSQVGAFTLASEDDSALLVTLPAGAYTAKVSGLGDTQGNALLEVYLLP